MLDIEDSGEKLYALAFLNFLKQNLDCPNLLKEITTSVPLKEINIFYFFEASSKVNH